MTLSAGSIAFGFLAGALSLLSPCVLPLLPLVLDAAIAASRRGVIALAAGLVLAFVGVGLFVAMIGFSIGIDSSVLRAVSAVLLGVFGLILISGTLHERFAVATGPLANVGNTLIDRIAPSGASGQFLLGLLLGAVWAPCVGPTLGAATLLAAQGRDLPNVIAVMAAFGLGSVMPIIMIGRLSRQAFAGWRNRLSRAGRLGERILGACALAVAVLVLSGLDRRLETALLSASPVWLIQLLTKF